MYNISIIRKTSDLRELYDQISCYASAFNPFHFSLLLEESGSITPDLGWSPHHFLIKFKDHSSLIIPAYSKSHSWGEFSFDHPWVDLAKEIGVGYYPKVQICFPFIPTQTDYFSFQDEKANYIPNIIREITLMIREDFSSIHFTFPKNLHHEILENSGFIKTSHPQYIWKNNELTSFTDFLSRLGSKRRYMISKERHFFRQLQTKIYFLRGDEISFKDLDEMYNIFEEMYCRQGWGEQAFNLDFLYLLYSSMRENLLIGFAEKDNERVAATLNFINSNTIFGRFWGTKLHSKFLHFEICYYVLIEYAIEKKIQTIEVGSTGDHKEKRGFEKYYTDNYHWISNKKLKSAILKKELTNDQGK